MRPAPLVLLGLAAVPLLAADPKREPVPYEKWTVTGPLLRPGPAGAFDEAAVKDPSVVFFDGRYHVFYTSKPKKGSGEFGTALGYVSAPTLEGLAEAPRTEMRPVVGGAVVAPQVFYFRPHKLWYLIGHEPVGSLRKLAPVYLTNPDVRDVRGWSKPQPLKTARKDKDAFWIDFWVICDDRKAHLFYTDHTHRMFRMECPVDKFPGGFADAAEEVAFEAKGKNGTGDWHLHEAAHVYKVKSSGKYLALLEGAYAHPTRKRYWDSRNRFLFAATADRLEGPWVRVEAADGEFLGEASRLFTADGKRSRYGQVSHPELIRGGHDERLEIPDYKLQLLFQAFDASKTPDDYDYDTLPWELALMRNH